MADFNTMIVLEDTGKLICAICSVICMLILLIFIVADRFVRVHFGKYEIPIYWSRHWILSSILFAGVIILCFSLEQYSCTVLQVKLVSTVACDLSSLLLVVNILISLYDPYLFAGRRQQIVWIIFVAITWLIGIAGVFVVLKSKPVYQFGSKAPQNFKMNRVVSTTSRDGLLNTTSILDRLDIEFNSDLLKSSYGPVSPTLVTTSNISDTTPALDARRHCFLIREYYVFDNIMAMLYIVFACCSLPALHKDLLSKINRCFKQLHSPLSESHRNLYEWVTEQRVTSALFLLFSAVDDAWYLACTIDYQNYCKISSEYFVAVKFWLFALLCFLLKDVRNVFCNVIAACHGPVSRPRPVANMQASNPTETC